MNKYILIFCCLFAANTQAEPNISSISIENNKLIINGSNFGSGPNVNIFDTFESPTAQDGDPINIDSPSIGMWSNLNKYVPYTLESHSGRFSAKMLNNPQFSYVFPGGITEAFVSYWVRIPNGENFPGADFPGVFPTVSSWKYAWLIDLDYLGNSSDVCIPSHIGYGIYYIGGNDYDIVQGIGNEWWSWNSWVRMSVWLRANSTNPTANGDILFHSVSEEKGVTEKRYSRPIFDTDGPILKEYKYITIPGWIKSGAPLYDDIYIATGPNALAHVEIADSANYQDSTKVAIQPSESWTSSKITANINFGGFSSLENVYIFIWDKDGNRNTVGYPLSANYAPNPPTDLTL